jgi:hypothetical protein
MNKKTLSQGLIFAIVPAVLATAPVVAQEQSKIRAVTRYTVQTSRVGDFRAAIKEYNAILVKAGADRPITVWAALSGPTEFAAVRQHPNWASLDRLPGSDPKLKEFGSDLRMIASRIMQCVITSERVIDELQADVSTPMPQEMPKMVRVLRSRVKPDKVNEYLSLVRSEIAPAAKKGGANVFLVHRTRFGAPSNQFSSVIALNSWADLDGESPIIRGMGGQEAYERFLTKIRPLLESSEYNIYRFEPELSYIPAKSASKTSSDGR